ncbi:hypothetical protein C8A00DRAFT_40079 [Chaetomidium leptoderma]|uniref:SAP domain-containing protein n=1 Tax=Chaetomidium leptoderma TaxID=669021 RepID=A0AAN6VWM9_9PEZI|nr:hypothetical protein C8A00DRAFT_40079 [Chaetomidium leptoderma]
MADYNSMKVPELKKLLTERALPHTGNKADLIARLTENDKQKAADSAAPQADSIKPSAAEDEIDYEDDDVPATQIDAAPENPAVAAAAPAPTEETAAAAAPEEPTTTTEATTTTKPEGEPTTTTTAEPATAAAPAKPAFTQNLPPTDAQSEAEKRAARATRFGGAKPATAADDKDGADEKLDEAAQKAARASRFGVANDHVSALDSALPDRPRKRGRGAAALEGAEGAGAAKEGGVDGGRGSKRANRGGGGGGRNQQQQQQQRGRGRRQGGGGGRGGSSNAPKGGNQGGGAGARAAPDPAEKARMEARAKRFAAAAASS